MLKRNWTWDMTAEALCAGYGDVWSMFQVMTFRTWPGLKW